MLHEKYLQVSLKFIMYIWSTTCTSTCMLYWSFGWKFKNLKLCYIVHCRRIANIKLSIINYNLKNIEIDFVLLEQYICGVIWTKYFHCLLYSKGDHGVQWQWRTRGGAFSAPTFHGIGVYLWMLLRPTSSANHLDLWPQLLSLVSSTVVYSVKQKNMSILSTGISWMS